MPWNRFEMQHLAVPAVTVLIALLAYGSQLLVFPHLAPGDLSPSQKRNFNLLVAGIWISYYRAVRTEPGRIPKKMAEQGGDKDDAAGGQTIASPASKENPEKTLQRRQRWCRKCECVKPPRAHHCKVCKRCIPKMDHHCPWTANCVSHFTLPHFIRFLFYATTSMLYLQSFFFTRAALVWENRDLPSYLGPSMTMLSLLVLFLIVNSFTLFGVGIMFVRSVYDVAINTTTIESWELSRHHQLLRRAKAMGGFLYGPDGQEIRIKHQEFPYDIGIWSNLCQTLGSSNPLQWFWVFARGRTAHDNEGLVWETNGFEDPDVGWPPIDPDRIPRSRPWGSSAEGDVAFTHEGTTGYGELSPQEEVEAFRRRQEADLQRQQQKQNQSRPWQGDDDVKVRRRKRFRDRFDENARELRDDGQDGSSGEEGWRDGGGNRLDDLGVDETIEFYDEDDIPLGQLIRQRRVQTEMKQQ